MDHHQKSSPEQTLQMIECGNLEINKIVEKGILLLGNTKAGKTTTSLFLTHQNLEGALNNAKSVVYKSKNVHEKYKVAKIGDFQSVSQTQIPNFLEYTLLNKQKIFLIDCPGYLDSFGCFRIISNRFFHYQVFSHVKKIKFILTFTYNNMGKKADQMKSTFKEFLKSFENLESIKEKVFNATAIMITSVPREHNLQYVIERFQTTPDNLGSDLSSLYIQLKRKLIQEKRIFIFHQAEIGKNCEVNNTLIQDISKSTQFWEREDDDNQISMKNIKISINQYIGEDEKQFQKEQKELQAYYKTNIQNDIARFVDILVSLSNDNQRVDDSSEFVNKILAFVKTKQAERKTQKNKVVEALYTRYEPKRKEFRQKIFSRSASDSISALDAPFWFLRLKTQKAIEKEIVKVVYSDERSVGSMKLYFEVIKNILEDILWLVKGKKEKNGLQQKKKNEAVLQFAYQIFKFVDISNKLYNLVIKSIPDDSKQEKQAEDKHKSENMRKLQSGMQFILIEYPSEIKKLFLNVVTVNYQTTVINNLSKYKLEGFTPKGYEYAASFFEEVQGDLKEQQGFEKKSEEEKSIIKSSFSNQILKIKGLSFQKLDGKSSVMKPDSAYKILEDMVNSHKSSLSIIKQNRDKDINTELLIIQNSKIILLIGVNLQQNGKLDLALEVYDSIFEAHKVFQILDLLQHKTRNRQYKEDVQLMDHLRNYMFKAAKYGHQNVALKKGQEALMIALKNSWLERKNEIGNFIKELKVNGLESTKEYLNYIQQSSKKQIELPKALIDKIFKESGSQLSPTKK